MKITKKMFFSFLFLIGIILVPDFIHPYYYKIKSPSDCEHYKNFSPQQLIDIFKDKSEYTKIRSVYFLYECKNKNATPYIYNSIIYFDSKEGNPLRLIPITIPEIRATGRETVPFMLSELLHVPNSKMNINDNYDSYSKYWSKIIEEQLKFQVNPISINQ